MVRLDPVKLVLQLRQIDEEQPWLEFKENLSEPEKIGRTISALANGATLSDHENAYLVWGVNDATHDIVGSSFDFTSAKKGNENLQNWIRSALSPNADFDHVQCNVGGKNVSILTIGRASGNPVLFQNVAYVRDGSYVKPLSKIPALEQKLWAKLQSYRFETSPVTGSIPMSDVEELLDCSEVLKLFRYNSPRSPDLLTDVLVDNGLIVPQDDGNYCITVTGAILFARDLTRFDSLSRKTLRLIRYQDSSKFQIEKDIECVKGYAVGFGDVEKYLSLMLPTRESIEGATRQTRFVYPPVAIRELVSNACIHQDLGVTGVNLSVEIFSDRIVVTNPGGMLVKTDRLVNATPVSRNENIARIMRRIGLCEELGSGWDRIVESCEEMHLPAPMVVTDETSTSVTVVKATELGKMSTQEKLWSCYLHACALYARNLCLTNGSLRERFGLENTNSGSVTVSRVIKMARDRGLIKPFDENASPRNMSYVPYWA